MTSTQPRQRSWFFRQSWLVQFALIFFGAIALLAIVTIFWGMSSSFGSDDGETGSRGNPAAPATISKRPTATVAASPTTGATTGPTEEPAGERVMTATDPAPTTNVAALEEIYALAATSLQQPGMVYHRTITLTSESGLFSQEGVIEQWVDANENVVRTEISTEFTQAPEPASVDVTVITKENVDYSVYRDPDQRMDTSPANTCYGASEAVSVVLGCPGFTETSTTTIERGEYEGQPTIILKKTGEAHGSDESWTFASRLYLDVDTFLPFAEEIEGTMDYGQTVPMEGLQTIEHEFIPRDSLSTNFFDIVTLAEEQIEMAQVSYPVYWLGTSFEPKGELPPLTLDTAGPPSPADYPYDLILTYRTPSSAEDSGVAIQVWSAEAWHAEWDETIRADWESQACGIQQEIEIPDGQATTFMGLGDVIVPPSPVYGIATPPPVSEGECGSIEYTRYETIVDLGETVLFIYPYFPKGSPYQSQAGLKAIVQGLELRN